MDKIEPLLNELKKEIGDSNFNIWFNPADISLNDNTLIFSVPNKFFKDIINESYREIILNIWKNLNNDEDLNMIYNINEASENNFAGKNNNIASNVNLAPVNIKTEVKEKNTENKKSLKKEYLNINEKYTFENFVIGSGNQFAHAASVAVANLPGQTYNPMFIYSDVGLGKTHLLNAIANKIIKEKNLNVYLDLILSSKLTISLGILSLETTICFWFSYSALKV